MWPGTSLSKGTEARSGRSTVALLWEGGLECQDFILKATESHGRFWSRTCWQSWALERQILACAGKT